MSGIEMLVHLTPNRITRQAFAAKCPAQYGSVSSMRKFWPLRRQCPLCTSTDDGGTGIRPDQGSAWYPQIPLTRLAQRDIRVEAYLRHAQSSRIVSPPNRSGRRLADRQVVNAAAAFYLTNHTTGIGKCLTFSTEAAPQTYLRLLRDNLHAAEVPARPPAGIARYQRDEAGQTSLG